MITIEYLRTFRVGPFTIFDTAASFIGVLILSPLLSWVMAKFHLKVSLAAWLWWTMPISVLFHIGFNQSTPVMKILTNPGQPQFYLTLFILILMSYMGFRRVSRIP